MQFLNFFQTEYLSTLFDICQTHIAVCENKAVKLKFCNSDLMHLDKECIHQVGYVNITDVLLCGGKY